VRGAAWGAEVLAAVSAGELNALLVELTHAIGRPEGCRQLEDWWKPWEGFSAVPDNAPQSRRCQFTDGNKCKCKCAALPGKIVCKRHIRKQLACTGVQGFQLEKNQNTLLPPGAEKWAVKGKFVEVIWEGEPYQAKIIRVNNGQATVAYLGEQGQATAEQETIPISSSRIRPPSASWSKEAGAAASPVPGTPMEAGVEDAAEAEDGDGDKAEEDDKAEEEGEEEDEEDEEDKEDAKDFPVSERIVTPSAVLLRIYSLDQASPRRAPLAAPRPAPHRTVPPFFLHSGGGRGAAGAEVRAGRRTGAQV
jgi:hypothetical protein